MRFRQAHKTSTYAVALSSFGAVALSGLLSIVVVLLGAVAIVSSWRWEPPRIRYERWELAWTILAVLVFLYQVLSVLIGSEVIIAGAHFLVFLLVLKLFNRRSSKDYLHIFLLSFLMMTAGTVLNAGMSYGVFFLFFVVSSTWALTILHLRRELENNLLLRHRSGSPSDRVRVERVMNSTRIVGRKFFVGTGLVSLCVFASALALFLLFPRIGFGLFFDKGRGGVTMTGFSDGVELGGHGLIKKDATVVMRVEVDKAYRGRSAPALHWRGVAFDRYEKGRWDRSREAPHTQSRSAPGKKTTTHYLLYDQLRTRDSELSARKSDSMKQSIYLEPLGSDVLFGASMPLAIEVDTKIKNRTRAHQNDEIRQQHSAGVKYKVYSQPTPPSAAALRAAGGGMPEGFSVYLQLPEEIPECEDRAPGRDLSEFAPNCRVRDLARFVTKDASNNYDKALAIETWLRANLDYTLQMESPDGMEPVEFFLFQRKKGHCEYFSSAMSILARSVGVPIRNVNGFLGGEWNEYDNYIAVRAGDAHSWTEVYFEGYGWVTFDPTPGGQSDLLGRGSAGFLDRMRRIADTMRFKWFKWVIEYDFYQQLKLFSNVGNQLKGSADRYLKQPLKGLKNWAKRHRAIAATLVIALGLGIFLISWLRSRKQGRSNVRTQQRKRTRDPVVDHYRAASKFLKRRGYGRADATTPREFASGLVESKVAGAEAYQRLTEMYYRAEYGAAPTATSDAGRADELKQSLVAAMRTSKGKQKADVSAG